jgi:hypothetical protein
MKFWTVLFAAFVVVMLGIVPSVALPDGPDPANGKETFDIFFKELVTIPNVVYDQVTFVEATGWDFGDRNAYRCAWAEFYQGSDERFEVHFERIPTYDPGILVNDRYGGEAEDGPAITALCGDGAKDNLPQWDNTDHFPHGTALTVTEGSTTIATLDLHRDECARGYWVAGDEPGEAWLWWDADGPTSNGHHTLNCGGGPGDPVAVLRMTVQNVDAGLDYCIEDSMDGDICTTPVVTLGTGTSVLVCPDGSTPQIVTADPLKVGC